MRVVIGVVVLVLSRYQRPIWTILLSYMIVRPEVFNIVSHCSTSMSGRFQ